MQLVSIPANPVPDDVVTGTIKTPDGVTLRFARWAPPPGRKGTGSACSRAAPSSSKNISRPCAICAAAALRSPPSTGAARGSDRKLKDPRKGYVGDFFDYEIDIDTFMNQVVLPDCPPPLFALAHSMGAAVLLRVARHGARWFDRIVLSAPMVRLAGRRNALLSKITVHTMRTLGLGSLYVPGGSSAIVASGGYIGNPVTSDPVRYARTGRILEEEPVWIGLPTVSWLSAAYRTMADIADQGLPARCASR